MTSEEEAWTVAFSYVLAPTLLMFVLWVLTEAVKNGKQRLYFLARDGYMMYQVAEYICKQWKIPVECRYLYCSRYALRMGEYCLLGENCLDYICLGGMEVSFESLMRRGGLTDKEAMEITKAMNMQERTGQIFSSEQIQEIHFQLQKNNKFLKYVMAHSREEYPNVIGYLKQEGLLDDISYAIVDSGWVGSIQKSISHLVESTGCNREIDGFYFGLYEYAAGMERARYHSYFFTPTDGNSKKALFCNNLFECIFSAPEGMTCGYQKVNDRYEPRFYQSKNQNRKRIEKGMELVLTYVGAYVERRKIGSDSKNLKFEKKVLSQLIAAFMAHPTMEEAKVFGKYVFNDDVTGKETHPVAARLSKEELRQTRLLQRLYRYATHKGSCSVLSAWPEGSSVLAKGEHTNRLMQDVIYKYLLYSRKSLEQRRRKGK